MTDHTNMGKKPIETTTLEPIDINVVDHKTQKYDTCGDYFIEITNQREISLAKSLHHLEVTPIKKLNVRVSKLGDWRYEALIVIHELIEYFIVSHEGVQLETIDEFDRKFESVRTLMPDMIGDQEPGDMTTAPYHQAHVFATNIERQIAIALNVDWDDYNEKVNGL